MKKQSKRARIAKIRRVLITIISVILATTLIISLMSYKKAVKKIEAKEAMRELILTIEAVEINKSIEFDDSETISDIKIQGGEKVKAIKNYSDLEKFINIEALTLGDAKKILNNEEDFKINSEGKFVNIK